MADPYPLRTEFAAKHFHRGRQGNRPLWVVLHDAEVAETPTSAEGVARGFHRGQRIASAHLTSDNNSTVRSVLDTDTAFAAKHANQLGLHLELAGYARQTRAEWLDTFGTAMLHDHAAPAVAHWCRTWGIPPVMLSLAELRAFRSGITTHAMVQRAWPSSGHTDPGVWFPADLFIHWVRQASGVWTPTPHQEDDVPDRIVDPGDGNLWTGNSTGFRKVSSLNEVRDLVAARLATVQGPNDATPGHAWPLGSALFQAIQARAFQK